MDRTGLGICRAARIVLRRADMVRRMMRSPFSFAIDFCKGTDRVSTAPYSQDGDLEQGADRQADAMKAQLRKDVASWSKARNDTAEQLIVETSAQPVRQTSLLSAAKPRKSKRAASAVKTIPLGTKPFSMSYDGGSTADYIQYMIDRGAR